MLNKIKSKILGVLVLVFALIFLANAQAQLYPTCNDMFDLYYSPSDLVSGMEFNVTFKDWNSPISAQTVLLEYNSPLILLSGSNPQNVIDVGGFGQAIWRLNSSASYNGTINATVFNGTSNCTITKQISIAGAGLVGTPNIIVTPTDWTMVSASKTEITYTINYNNIGDGNAYNVSTLFTMPNFTAPSNPRIVNASSNVTVNQGIYTNALCGIQNLSMQTNYRNILGNPMPVVINYDSFNVSGSDLDITHVYLPQTTYYDDSDISLTVSVRNINRTSSGGFPAEANNVVVSFQGRPCSSSSTVGIEEVRNFTCGYHINERVTTTRTITFTISVDGTNDCSNWASATKTHNIQLTIRPRTTSGGGGGGGSGGGSTGGGSVVPVCGNKICEAGENSANCPIDCGAIQPTTPDITETPLDYLIVYSHDGKASVFAPSGTKFFMEKMPIINPKSWIIIKEGNITTPLPYGIFMIRQYEFIPNGLEFIPDATISFKYNNLELKNGGVYIMYYDEWNKKWTFVDSTIDRENNLISTKVKHFSNYALVTKESLPLTGFVLFDSAMLFLKNNIILNVLMIFGLILLILLVIILSKRKGK